MAKRAFDLPSINTVDETAAEFLRAQEVKVPSTVEELQQATTSANDTIEHVLFHGDRWRAMKEDSEEESSQRESLYDEWVDATLDLEEVFIDEGDGALGRRLIELLSFDDATFEKHRDEARLIVQQTSAIALRLYPFTHRLVDLGIASDRSGVVERLSSGDLIAQEKVQNVSVTPRRRTIIGLLRDLDARLPEDQRTHLWSLEVAPELPSSVMISDPFQSGNDDLSAYWRQRIGVVHEVYGRDTSILSLSGDKTLVVISELENIVEHAGNEELRGAAQSLASWLDGKQMYYTDPDPRDFELYHLGMEDSAKLMEIFHALDVIKHADPEFFFELLGINPEEGGRSAYFGSFLHKALFNTQRTINHADPALGEMAIRTMLHQLLTLDEHVQTYSAVVSQESLKTMAGEVKKSIDATSSPQSKAQILMMMAVPYSRMAIDAEVRRQLDAMRESSSENISEELRRRIDDIEHPLKLAEYLVALPKHATDDIAVRHELRKILSDEQIEAGSFRGALIFDYGRYAGEPERSIICPLILPSLYARIPLIDETRQDLGFALRVRVAIRDAFSLARTAEEYRVEKHSEKTRARQFLKFVMPDNLYREDFEAVKDHFSLWDQTMTSRFNYASRRSEGNFSGIVAPTELRLGPTWSEEDKAFFIGQMIVGWENHAKDRRYDFISVLMKDAEYTRPDLVFLSIIAHPQGKEVAFKYFDKFCEVILPERMREILSSKNNPVQQFQQLFDRHIPQPSSAYAQYLRQKLSPHEMFGTALPAALTFAVKDIPTLVKLNRVYIAGETPWTKKVKVEAETPRGTMGSVGCVIDAWEIWDVLGKPLAFNPEDVDARNPDGWSQIDTLQKYSPNQLGQIIFGYFATGKTMGADKLLLVIHYIEEKRDQANKQAYK